MLYISLAQSEGLKGQARLSICGHMHVHTHTHTQQNAKAKTIPKNRKTLTLTQKKKNGQRNFRSLLVCCVEIRYQTRI